LCELLHYAGISRLAGASALTLLRLVVGLSPTLVSMCLGYPVNAVDVSPAACPRTRAHWVCGVRLSGHALWLLLVLRAFPPPF